VLLLTAADVEELIDMEGAITASNKAFTLSASGRATIPIRHAIDLGYDNAVTLFMPGFLPSEKLLGLKVGSLIQCNVARNLPASLCTIVLFNMATGAAAAVIEATWLTALRTGAGIGAATRALARSDARIAAMIGAGGMAYHSIEAMITARPALTRILIWNRTLARGRALRDKIAARFGKRCEFVLADDLEQAVRSADIVTACTSSVSPLVQGAWLRPGTHINLAGAHGRTMREGDDELIARAAIVTVDKLDAASASGEIAIPIKTGVLAPDKLREIGMVIDEKCKGRKSAADITVFKSVGIAAQDLVTAAMIVERAFRQKRGTMFKLREDLD
jgi:ornithine cyclodeaminase/alanine dehydrogenase-like protein (mu-crystallin family)